MKTEKKEAIEFLRGIDPSMRNQEVIESIHEFSGEFLLYCIGQALKQNKPIITNGEMGFTPLEEESIEVSVHCDDFPANEFGLRFIWMKFPSYAIPQIGDIIYVEGWDEGVQKYFSVKEKEFVFVENELGEKEFDSVSLTVETVD